MRVLYVIDALGEGGTEMSLAELVPALAEAGTSSTIACLRSRGGEGVQHALEARGVDVRVLRARTLGSQVREVVRIARDTRPDLLHTMLFRSNLVGRLAGRRIGVPVVSSVVNTSYGPERLADPTLHRGRMRIVRAVDAYTARHLTAALHAVSCPVKQHAIETLGVKAEQITVIERGRDPRRLGVPSPGRTQAARSSLELTDDAEVLVSVGRRERQKGHRHLIDAVAELAPARPRLVLVVAGRGGGTTAELDRQVDLLGLGERVRFLGHRSDVPDILAAGDVFVFPSLYEGLPGVLVEAMALALPVVATDIPAVREVVEPGASALLVPAADASAMAAAIASLLDDAALRQALGVRGRSLFLERYQLARSVDAMRSFYEALA